METLRTICDMGAIKIYSKDLSCFFANKVGDIPNQVDIYEDKTEQTEEGEFLGHFTAKSGEVYLSHYDCEDDEIFQFPKGRWFVFLVGKAHFQIVKQDDDLHA